MHLPCQTRSVFTLPDTHGASTLPDTHSASTLPDTQCNYLARQTQCIYLARHTQCVYLARHTVCLPCQAHTASARPIAHLLARHTEHLPALFPSLPATSFRSIATLQLWPVSQPCHGLIAALACNAALIASLQPSYNLRSGLFCHLSLPPCRSGLYRSPPIGSSNSSKVLSMLVMGDMLLSLEEVPLQPGKSGGRLVVWRIGQHDKPMVRAWHMSNALYKQEVVFRPGKSGLRLVVRHIGKLDKPEERARHVNGCIQTRLARLKMRVFAVLD
eukprot:scaffold9053_cov19-Tisochrysis_lutea.AAC.2